MLIQQNKPQLTIKIPNHFKEQIPIPLFLSKEKYGFTFNNLHNQIHYLFNLLITSNISWNQECIHTYQSFINEYEIEEKLQDNIYYLTAKKNFLDEQYSENSFYFFIYYIDSYYYNKIILNK
jgi:hypothetical protein